MKKMMHLVWAGIAVVVAIRVLDWLLFPVLQVLLTVSCVGLLLYVVANGWRRL
jgi:hypothetical protein